ncbi:type II toxin-antitoxin system RelE/ParE family toxin [Rhodoferax antarcticus]|uniref:type II toxin-antitoxin system RelE/ParE family toxin n=1 Tax=Rhodoferax antarcticus TaxID=81479 RepID=UPI00222533F5|nr:type II toxin-antitoxin system RelE/ParE family toxin [Rhodoferax antarcticus]MCW2314172.1 toxin ParE1/3/4 [Rhodoferax antarcticus]
MKLALLRPLAKEVRRAEVRYYREKAGQEAAIGLVTQTKFALEQIQRNPGIGSARWGQLADIDGLRAGRVTGFPLVWLYFERPDHLDVIRLVGERQDALSMLGTEH